MFNFFVFFKKGKENKREKEIEKHTKVGSGLSINNSITQEVANLRKVYAKPKTYTGNRKLYDSGKAKKDLKINDFSNNETVIDEYTGAQLTLTKKEALLKYGKNWTKHLAEADHIHPVKRIFEKVVNNFWFNAWTKNDDINEITNSKDNLQTVSREFNNKKRERTNEELVTDEEYSASLNLSDEKKEVAIRKGRETEKIIDKKLRNRSIKNAISSGHNAGMKVAKQTAVTSVTITGILNTVDVIKGKKTVREATKDVSIATAKAAITGYTLGSGGSVVTHSLSYSKSPFLKALSNSNVPAKIITAVITTGDIVKRYSNGEISTQECILELGERGLNIATAGYSMAVGQALIPIPIVGGAVGALVGSVLTSKYYNTLISELRNKELAHNERLRIMAECKEATRQIRAFREELQTYLDNYFYDYKNCFDEAFSEIEISFKTGNADGIISGANKITKKLDGKVYYNNVKEFKTFLDSKEVDVF